MNPTTRANLEAALAGEALTALRYRCFAATAAEEGLADVAGLFDRIASEALTGHAMDLVQLLGLCGDTRENLACAIDRETAKHQRRYAEYASAASLAGDGEVARLFSRLAGDEHRHAASLRASLQGLMDGERGGADVTTDEDGPGDAPGSTPSREPLPPAS